MRNARLDEAQAGIKIVRRNINNLRYTRWNHPSGRKWRGTKEPLDICERESEKAGLKLNILKTNIMASGPLTSWQIDGETMEKRTDFIFLGSQIIADGDCSRGIKRHFLLGRKAMTNSIFKSRDITLPTKVCLVQAMVFSVVMYGCESWTIKKAEHWRIDAVSVGEDSWESLELQGDPTNSFCRRSALGVLWKEWC